MVAFTLVQKNTLKTAIKILTDYPRDDLASDEVQQALITACAEHQLDMYNIDVGSVPGMDTVVAAFKTAQLGLNSKLGYGHIIHTNCAPRRNIVSKKSKGEGVVLGLLENGACLLTVNSGYTLSAFYDLAKMGKIKFFETKIPVDGSQFRSRDYFPGATAQLARFLSDKLAELGQDKITQLYAQDKMETLFSGFELLGEPLDFEEISQLPKGAIWYIDNFGNMKLNISHDEIVRYQETGTILSLVVGDTVVDAIVGQAGFSQGEGILALTRGSSGWDIENGHAMRFTEVFLRGGSAAGSFKNIMPGIQVLGVKKKEIQRALKMFTEAGIKTIATLDLYFLSEARLIQLFADYGLIKNGFDDRGLTRALDEGSLIKQLS